MKRFLPDRICSIIVRTLSTSNSLEWYSAILSVAYPLSVLIFSPEDNLKDQVEYVETFVAYLHLISAFMMVVGILWVLGLLINSFRFRSFSSIVIAPIWFSVSVYLALYEPSRVPEAVMFFAASIGASWSYLRVISGLGNNVRRRSTDYA